MNKKGQIAVWVILALVIAGGVILFVYVQNRPYAGEEYDPQQYIKKCVQEVVNEAVNKMLPQGGFLEPKLFKIYNDTRVEYICKSEGYYVPCVNIHPMLLTEITRQIKDYSEPRIEKCFDNMKAEAEKRNREVEMGDMNLSIGLAPRKIILDIDREIRISEEESQRIINNFEIEVMSPIYDLASIAINIANNERKYCYFEYVGYMALDRTVDIRKFVMSDSTIIYSIKDLESGKIMNMAIKSCTMPVGGL